jgi:phosphatidylinositol alpha-1,6-mannosyltransferase
MARILLITYEFSPFRGGIATVAEGLSAGAAAHGHDVHLLAPDYGSDRTMADRGRAYTVHRFPGDFCSILSIRKLTRHARQIRRHVRRLSADLVHGVDPQSQMALTLLARLGMVRDFGFTVHGTELLRYSVDRLPHLWMRGAFRRPVGTTVVSHAVRDLLMMRDDVDPDRIAVSYPGIARVWRERPKADRRAVRATVSAGDDDLVLITVARRVPDKGQIRVIDALSRLPEGLRERIVYVVAGTGPESYARLLTDAAGRTGVRLQLSGRLDADALIDAVDASDLFVMLSRRSRTRLEGLGLAFLEAAARGVPSIATRTGGTGEAVLDRETGVLVPEDATPDVVAGAIANLVTDTDTRTRLGRAARGRALEFTFRRHAAETFDPMLDRLGRSAASVTPPNGTRDPAGTDLA